MTARPLAALAEEPKPPATTSVVRKIG